MMNVAKNWEWRDDNPFEGVAKSHEGRRDRLLSAVNIDRLCDALEQHPNQSAANAIRLILLTGVRRGEVLTATWKEFNLELGIWTKTSHHTKQKRTDHVPLSPPALQLIASNKGECQRTIVRSVTPNSPASSFGVRNPTRIDESRSDA
jgi:integrase